ncbi:hypothetical protein N781_02340 [Pontibacillus halophilus JSM 076056 = DSM 19796]|uniref:YfhE family protein n=1 Tax=Pontibacillus halophilus JSM 076056 = DSM 19796 TaxID=1385510 RepID=A0A0A5IE51_9BACI|nr:YfhE family protein [Pontibacillus halophilus]KGX94112.1 hypothetical protein N781_02340 [Pontibacillus halophilus JSM 076056 = DSM 19796]
MNNKAKEAKKRKGNLTKAQEISYLKDFKRANKATLQFPPNER